MHHHFSGSKAWEKVLIAETFLFTVEDITDAFKGKEKLDPLKKLNRPHHQEAFRYKTMS